MHSIVAAADAAHFLSLVPSLLGFVPTRSLVVVPFRGSRSLGGMRVDLPPDGADLDAVASRVVGMVCRIPDADGLASIVYTDASAADLLPGSALIGALGRAADVCGIRIVDALAVAADGWGSLFDSDCPPGGRPLAEIAAAIPPDWRAPDGDQAAGATLPSRSAADRRAVGAALKKLDHAVAVACGAAPIGLRPVDPEALAAVARLDDPPILYEEVLTEDPSSRSPMTIALLAWCFARPSLRDVALVQWATDVVGGAEAADAQLRWEDGEDYPAHLGMIMWGEAPRPDPRRLEAALELVREIAALVPRRDSPGPLALCAWLSWALGRSTHADEYARRALRIDPRHGLADILQSFVRVGHLPDWAFRVP